MIVRRADNWPLLGSQRPQSGESRHSRQSSRSTKPNRAPIGRSADWAESLTAQHRRESATLVREQVLELDLDREADGITSADDFAERANFTAVG